jgi:hypothetical protein
MCPFCGRDYKDEYRIDEQHHDPPAKPGVVTAAATDAPSGHAVRGTPPSPTGAEVSPIQEELW